MNFAHLIQAYPKRLDRIEEGCITTLVRAGCWENGNLARRYWSLHREAGQEKHKARAARKMRVVHAWECLCLVRELKAMISAGGDSALKVAIAAGVLESKVSDVITGETVAKGMGSRREEGDSEHSKLSAWLYLFAREAYRNKFSIGERSSVLSAADNYIEMRKDDIRGETYDPLGSRNALRKQAGRWNGWGLM